MKHKVILSVLIFVLVLISSSCGGGKNVKPNILLITIDTLRRDHLGIYGYPRNTSPFIDELARNGLRFKHVITPIPATAGSHASILTSLHPITHTVIDNAARMPQNAQTIAEVLNTNGYYTIGAVAVQILSSKFYFSRGFDSFSDKWKKKIDFNRAYDRSAQSVNNSLFKQIDDYLLDPENKEKPLFIWVHYFDPHWPYQEWDHVTFKNKLADQEDEQRKPMRRYDKEIYYTDEHIKKLYRYLEDKGIAKRMVTCITADHGEQFGDHGNTNCHVDFYSETSFVPLIFHGYRIPQKKTVDSYVSTMDIAVTLLKRANLSFAYPTEGIDLLEMIKKPGPHPHRNRKYLISGLPACTRSLQLLGYPFSYILNFDYHYKYWFITDPDHIPIDEKRFRALPAKRQKHKGNRMIIPLPMDLGHGMKYTVLRADIEENKGLSFKIRLAPSLSVYTNDVGIEPSKKHLNIIYPVTISDRIVVYITLENGTILENVRYAFISRKEFLQQSEAAISAGKGIKNKIFQVFPTLRKKKKKDEIFDLANDVEMENNLVDVKQLKPTMLKYKKLIYALFKYYYQKKLKILDGVTAREKLSPEEKDMLKSLGYL